MVSKKTIPPDVFISYSHKNKKFCDELLKHLKPFVRSESIFVWSDAQIIPGDKWFDEIKHALSVVTVVVFLVTSDFLASDFIHHHELGPTLRKAKKGKVRVLPVLVGTCSHERTLLRNYQAANSPDKPLTEMRPAERDRVWKKICGEIMGIAGAYGE